MRSTPSICHGCAVGCSTQVQTRDDRVVRYMSRENPLVDDGWLCDGGRYGFHFVHDQARLLEPRIGRQGDAVGATQAEAVAAVARRLQDVVQESGAHRVGAIASPNATNEELFLFQRWIREVIGSPNLDHRVDLEAPAPSPDDFRLAIEEFDRCQVVYILGDQPTLDAAPILELRLKKARRSAGTRLVLGRNRSARQLLAELPEGATLAGVIAPEALAADAAVLQVRLGERGVEARRLTVLPAANSRGASDLGCLPEHLPGYRKADGRPGMSTWEMLEAASAGQLQALVLMGPSPLEAGGSPLLLQKAIEAVDLLVVFDILEGPLTRAADVAVPLHSFAEKDGTYTNLEGRVQRLRQAIPPLAKTGPDWRLLRDLANAWEAGWTYRQPQDVMADIVAAVPAYGVERAGDRARWWDA
jgi:predicted molibdopterin-dependent oxidoreductase YjgC